MFPGYANPESAGVTEIPESLIQDVIVTRETLAFLREHADAHPGTPWFACGLFPAALPADRARSLHQALPQPRPAPSRSARNGRRNWSRSRGGSCSTSRKSRSASGKATTPASTLSTTASASSWTGWKRMGCSTTPS